MQPQPRIGTIRVPSPAASRRTHLFAAALMWTLAGLGLSLAGAHWAGGTHSRLAIPVLLLAAAIGWLKARLILDRTAGRITRRIEERGDDRCLGGFLSWKSWCVVAAMILLGRLLRASPLPILLRGAIYFAIGAALVIASRRIWGRWRWWRTAHAA